MDILHYGVEQLIYHCMSVNYTGSEEKFAAFRTTSGSALELLDNLHGAADPEIIYLAYLMLVTFTSQYSSGTNTVKIGMRSKMSISWSASSDLARREFSLNSSMKQIPHRPKYPHRPRRFVPISDLDF
jgi:hypothetical protein